MESNLQLETLLTVAILLTSFSVLLAKVSTIIAIEKIWNNIPRYQIEY